MQPETFIFVGKSGCGKGTQAELLINTLKEKGDRNVFYLESGHRFREFIASDTWASQLSKDINAAGGLQPEFLAVWVWADLLIKNLKGDEHLVLDGTPRKLHEAPVLENALQYFKRVRPHVIYVNVSDTWATERMLQRHRGDDVMKSIETRLEWYKTDVVPVVEYLWRSMVSSR
jgi:adenylate kinase family enzyme